MELGSLRLLALHPAVADVPPNAALPGALQLAVLDLLAAPLAELAQTFLHVPLAVRNVRMIEAAEPAVCALPDAVTCRWGRGPPQRRIRSLSGCASRIGRARSNWWNVWTPCRAAAHWGLPGTCRFRSASKRGVCGFPSTSCLPEPDDVLLPETYPAREGRVTLRLCATSRSLAFACSLAEGCATILSVLNPEEGPMSDENNTAAGAAPSEGVDTGELEVTLTFELERRLMTVRDVETLARLYFRVRRRCARPGHAVRQRQIRRQGAPCGFERDARRTGRQPRQGGRVGTTGVNPLYFIVGMVC